MSHDDERLTHPSDDESSKDKSSNSKLSPTSGHNISPIRPQSPESPPMPVRPSVPRPTRPDAPVRPPLTATEEIDMSRSPQEQAMAALERLRQKMARVAEEYAQGKLNRAQFHAIYQRYQEQRDITEAMLQRDPKTGAWQNVVQPGFTGFLRKHFEAQVISYSIYHIAQKRLIVRTGRLQLPENQVLPILERLNKLLASSQQPPRLTSRKLKDDRVVVLVPGLLALSIVVYSIEPALAQLEMIQDMHRDFERANQQLLQQARFNPREMVFPHRALFET